MKKAWIVATALVLTALLLTGCDNGNVSGRNDGVVDGTNGTSVATLPTMGESQNPSQATGESTGATGNGGNSDETGSNSATGETGNSGATDGTGSAITGQSPGPIGNRSISNVQPVGDGASLPCQSRQRVHTGPDRFLQNCLPGFLPMINIWVQVVRPAVFHFLEPIPVQQPIRLCVCPPDAQGAVSPSAQAADRLAQKLVLQPHVPAGFQQVESGDSPPLPVQAHKAYPIPIQDGQKRSGYIPAAGAGPGAMSLPGGGTTDCGSSLVPDGRSALRQVAAVIQKFISKGLPVPKQLGHRRIVTVGNLAGIPAKKQLHEHSPQNGAVAENGDGLPRESGRSGLHAPDKPPGVLCKPLPAPLCARRPGPSGSRLWPLTQTAPNSRRAGPPHRPRRISRKAGSRYRGSFWGTYTARAVRLVRVRSLAKQASTGISRNRRARASTCRKPVGVNMLSYWP